MSKNITTFAPEFYFGILWAYYIDDVNNQYINNEEI